MEGTAGRIRAEEGSAGATGDGTDQRRRAVAINTMATTAQCDDIATGAWNAGRGVGEKRLVVNA